MHINRTQQVELLKNWLTTNNIDHKFTHQAIFICDDKYYLLITHKEGKIFNPKMALILDDQDLNLLEEYPVDYFVTLFGDKFYFFDEKDFKVENVFDEVGDVVGENMYIKDMHELRYVGKSLLSETFPHLGVHGGYDICNGSRSYKDWCNKAKWLNITTLGICEENTLAGTLLFQNACESAKINSIIGETITIQHKDNFQYQIKLYCKSDIGWRNLLQINTLLNITNNKTIVVEQLKTLTTDLICILTPTIPLKEIFNTFNELFEEMYYQLDFVEWSNSVKEEEWREHISQSSCHFKMYVYLFFIPNPISVVLRIIFSYLFLIL